MDDNISKGQDNKSSRGQEDLFDIKKYQGIVDLLGQAIDLFKDYQLTANDVKYKEFNKFYERYEQEKERLNFHDLTDRLTWCLSKEFFGQNKPDISALSFLLIGNYYQKPLEIKLINFLKQNAKVFSVYNTDNKQVEKDFDFNFYNRYDSSHKCYSLYYVFSNRFQEVTYLARRIYLMLKNGLGISEGSFGNEISVVISDSSYISLLKSIFPKYGIKYDIRMNYQISASPIYHLIRNILDMFIDCYNRRLLFHFFDNQLVLSNINIQLIDSLMRLKNQNDLQRYLEDTELLINNLTDEEKEKFPPEKIEQELSQLKERINSYFKLPDKLTDKIHFVIKNKLLKILGLHQHHNK